jgi:hypothetical protein
MRPGPPARDPAVKFTAIHRVGQVSHAIQVWALDRHRQADDVQRSGRRSRFRDGACTVTRTRTASCRKRRLRVLATSSPAGLRTLRTSLRSGRHRSRRVALRDRGTRGTAAGATKSGARLAAYARAMEWRQWSRRRRLGTGGRDVGGRFRQTGRVHAPDRGSLAQRSLGRRSSAGSSGSRRRSRSGGGSTLGIRVGRWHQARRRPDACLRITLARAMAANGSSHTGSRVGSLLHRKQP